MVLAPGDAAVDQRIEEGTDPRCFEDGSGVRARGHDRRAQPGAACRTDEQDRARIGIHAALAHHPPHDRVLAIAEPVHGLDPGGIRRRPLRQLDVT
jgi:hypothetical protein